MLTIKEKLIALERNLVSLQKQSPTIGVWTAYQYSIERINTILNDDVKQALPDPDYEPAFLTLPDIISLTTEPVKHVDPKGVLPKEGKVVPLTQMVWKFYFSKTVLASLRKDNQPDSRVGYFKGKIFTDSLSPSEEPNRHIKDHEYLGSGTRADVQYRGKWSDLPEIV